MDGGAIYNYGLGDVTITGTTFKNNNATVGGAIYNTANMTISDSTFENNNGTFAGGAIANLDNMSIVNSDFNNNLVTSNLIQTGFGGAIVNVGNLSVEESRFKNNIARDGAAIFNSGYVSDNNLAIGILNVTESNFTNNNARASGGAISSENFATTYIENSYFSENIAENGGGSIAVYSYSKLNVTSSEFVGNEANTGGAIEIYNTTEANITDCQFTSNNARASIGGAIYNNASTTITKSIFNGNTALNEGKNIYNSANLTITYSILNAEDSIYNKTGVDANISAEKNWWGHNDTTKATSPKDLVCTNFDVNYWLVLNTTATKTDLKAGESSDVAIDLTHLQDDTEINGNDLPVIPVTISTVSGNANETTINLVNGEGKVSYTASQINEGSLTADVYGNSSTVLFDNVKGNSTLNANVADITYGENATFYVTVTPATATGNVTFTVAGIKYTIELNSTGEGSKVVSGLAPGTYGVILTYLGDNNLNSSSTRLIFDVDKASSTIAANVSDIIYGETAKINIIASPSAVTGNVTFKLNNISYVVPLNNGKGTANIANLPAGTYSTTLTYNGDEYYYGTTKYLSFNVAKTATELSASIGNIHYGQDALVIVNVQGVNPTGNVSFTLAGKDYVLVIGEMNSKSISGLEVGNYTVVFNYNGDKNNNASSDTVNFTVTKADGDFSTKILVTKENASITVTGPKDATGNVTAIINGVTYTGALVNGSVSFEGIKYYPGINNVTVNYPGDKHYNNYEFKDSFNGVVPTTIIANNVVKYYKNGTQYVLTLVDSTNNGLSGQIVYITVNGKEYNRTTNENGSATLSINLNSGEYNITSVYNGSDIYESSKVINTVTVLNIPTTLTLNNLTKTYGDGSKLNVTLVDVNNNPMANAEVVIVVNGVNYYRTTDSNGVAYLNFNLGEGTYVVSSSFTGANYVSSTSNGIVIVKAKGESRNASLILADNINMSYKDGSKYTFTLKDTNGNVLANKTVSITINGATYTRTTNENGSAKLNINLVSGIYSVTTKFAGDNDYSASGITTSVYVHKANDTKPLTKIEVKSSKVVKGTQFVITLIDVDKNVLAGQTVTFTVNGKSYNRTSDNAGIAKLNINLKPGSYKIITAYAGNDLYASAASVSTNMEVRI